MSSDELVQELRSIKPRIIDYLEEAKGLLDEASKQAFGSGRTELMKELDKERSRITKIIRELGTFYLSRSLQREDQRDALEQLFLASQLQLMESRELYEKATSVRQSVVKNQTVNLNETSEVMDTIDFIRHISIDILAGKTTAALASEELHSRYRPQMDRLRNLSEKESLHPLLRALLRSWSGE